MRDVNEAIKWVEAHITEQEELKFGETKDILDGKSTLDLQIDAISRAFQFGYYVGAHSRNTTKKN